MTPQEISILSGLARLAVDDNINGRFRMGVAKLSSAKAIKIAEGLRNLDFEDPSAARFLRWAEQQLKNSAALVP